ncbi:MAG: PAS domain-containing protein [SAR324 cluster bacterium]|nr:PAS domain-containing protein [SAR324 cluster bacterium]
MSAMQCFDCPALEEFAQIRFALDQSSTVSISNPQGYILFVNDNFCKISKYSREELMGQDHRLLNSGYHDKIYIKNLWDTVLAGKTWKGEFRNQAKDNSIYWVDTTIVPFMDSNGKVRQFISIRHDITAIKEIITSLHSAEDSHTDKSSL